MRNLSIMLTPTISFFCIFFLLYHITVDSSTPRYIAADNILVDCGSSGKSTGNDDRDWIGDIGSKFFPSEEDNLKSNTIQVPKEGVVNKAPFTTARISYSEFTYVFPVTDGPKFVRLHFHPASYSGFDGSKDCFTVKSGSFTLLRNFSASVLADSFQGSFFKEFCISVEKKLILTFIPFSTAFYAFVNGIEIVSMPKNLYYSSQEGQSEEEVPVYVGQFTPFYINYTRALEMVCRLNVGGSLIRQTEDTGFFREWSPDTNYYRSQGIIPTNASFTPNYSKIMNYTAPDAIYWSRMSQGRNRDKNLQSNLTWALPVDLGFYYLVRLHFCEIEPSVSSAGDRRFDIYVDYQMAKADADVMSWTDGQKYTPIYKDYVVMMKNKGVDGEKQHVFSIDLHPRSDSFNQDAFLNGMEVFKLSDSDGNLAGPSEILPSLPAAPTTKESKTKKTVFIAIGSAVGFLLVLTSVCCMVLWKLSKSRRYGSYYPLSRYWCWGDPYKGKSARTKASSLPDEVCRYFSLDDIRIATNNFNDELIIGRGGFGNVYKGLIDDGTMAVAIKRLNPESRQGAREFKTEIEMLSQLRHGHLVSLIGYSNDGGEMVLIYEYMPNGTLSEHLFNTNNDPLTWKQRLDICVGAASGLHYLHTCMKNPIIHRDVKATNILLDDKMGSKVSDFGLSKMGLNQTAVSTVVKGTLGYLDPDYARRQQVTDKSDVYSFGVVLFEVLCGRKALDQKFGQEQLHLANWARKCIEKGTIYEIIDPYLKGKIAPECFKVFVEVAENCVRDQGIERPTMNDVMERLEFALELQQNADAAQEEINPSGDFTYQEVLSFRVSGRTTGAGAPQHNNNVYNIGPVLESDTSYPSLDSESVTVTSRDVFTENSNITT
ncbi:receptor-like protein kinase FERONIA [Quercus suber]|uniref:receptor-like protein kinase FERONIA n=1 Tax=Quercus suber TaxID=58331 RepID=UPI000CE1B4CA|nr:receptor-like protein kinase FERONIA [Quercus suber]